MLQGMRLCAGLIFSVGLAVHARGDAAETRPASGPSSAPATSSAPSSKPDSQPTPLNILLIETNAQAPGFTGFEGNKLARTPNLDRLSTRSRQFTRFYVPTPQVGPSRASLLTGQYPHVSGVTADDLPLTRRADAFPSRLQRAGYRCGFVGYWGVNGEVTPARAGMDTYTAITEMPHNDQDWMAAGVTLGGTASKADKYLDDWNGDRAVEALNKLAKWPFFLWVAFNGPAEPFVYPPGTEKSFPVEVADLPKTRTQNQNVWPGKLMSSPPAQRFRHILQQPDLKEPYLQSARSKYLAMISRIDENVGRILNRLDELKLTDHTLIVFTSTRGYALGDHALFGEGPAFFDELIRLPLLICHPEYTDRHGKVDSITSLVDLTPTLCQVGGAIAPRGMQGRSLLGLVQDTQRTGWADEAFFEYHREPPWNPAPPAPVVSPAPQAMPATRPALSVPPATNVPPGTHAPPPASVVAVPPGPGVVAVPPGAGVATVPPGATTRPGMPGMATTHPAPALTPAPQTAPPIATTPPPPPVTPPVEIHVRGIVTSNFKLTDYLDDQDLLYDLKRDPQELQNTFSIPPADGGFQYTPVQRILYERLKLWRKTTRDPRPPQ